MLNYSPVNQITTVCSELQKNHTCEQRENNSKFHGTKAGNRGGV